MKKNRIVFLFKISFSFVLLYYLLSRTDLAMIWSSLKSTNLFWVIGAFSLHFTGLLFSVLRWQLLLSAQEIKVPFLSLLNSYVVGTFFNNLLPTTVGGDTIRAYDTVRYSQNHIKSFTVVFVERVTGVMALVAIAFIALFLEIDKVGDIPLIWVSILVLLIIILGIVIIIQPKIANKLGKILDLPVLKKIKVKAQEAHQAIEVYKKKKKHFWKNMMYAFLLQINVIFHYYMISISLGFDISPIHFFLIIPIITVILIIPISINGIGLRENAFVLFLSKLGVEPASAIALSWIAYGMVVVWGVMGGLLYAFRGTNKEILKKKKALG